MIYMWFTGINCYKLAVEKDRDSIFTTITTIWNPLFYRIQTFMRVNVKIWKNFKNWLETVVVAWSLCQ
jgi:hypothetical protein